MPDTISTILAPAVSPATPLLPALPAIPVPISGDPYSLTVWMIGCIFYYGSTPTGQKLGLDVESGAQGVEKILSSLATHVEAWFTKLKG